MERHLLSLQESSLVHPAVTQYFKRSVPQNKFNIPRRKSMTCPALALNIIVTQLASINNVGQVGC